MSIDKIGNSDKPIKVTKTGEKAYKYEYADGTIKCVFDEKNSVTYNKKDNKNIKITNDGGDISVFNGKNINVDMGKSCTGISLEKCKDGYVNAAHFNVNSIRLEESTNMTVKADPEDIITSNGTKINPKKYEEIKINDKTYDKARMLSNKDASAQDRAKIYNEQLFGGQKFKDIKIEEGYLSTGHPVGGVIYKKASFPNGDIVIKTDDGTFVEYNSNNNKGIKISADLGNGLKIKNANNATIIATKIGNVGVLNNSVNCTYSSSNGQMNSFETLNCKNTTLETDSRDNIKVDGKNLNPEYGKRVIK